jgi:hypothetical protein
VGRKHSAGAGAVLERRATASVRRRHGGGLKIDYQHRSSSSSSSSSSSVLVCHCLLTMAHGWALKLSIIIIGRYDFCTHKHIAAWLIHTAAAAAATLYYNIILIISSLFICIFRVLVLSSLVSQSHWLHCPSLKPRAYTCCGAPLTMASALSLAASRRFLS